MNEINKLIHTLKKLRSPEGCQWDREQNLDSIKPFILEEAYEVIEAINSIESSNNYDNLKEELGDLLCQIIFAAELASEKNHFTLADSVNAINEKLIRRHPHVFDKRKVSGTDEIKKNWEEIKSKEKNNKGKSVLDNIPKSLPALLKAHKIQSKAAVYGFEWDGYEGAYLKIHEELDELHSEIKNGSNSKRIEEEIGDLLFSVVNLARYFMVDTESALENTIKKFARRFRYIEENLKKRNISLEDTTLDEMDQLWEESKSL